MLSRRPRQALRAARAVAIVALIGLQGLALAAPTPAAAVDGSTDTAVTTYTMNPAAGRLDVEIDVTVTNSKPSVTTYVPCFKYVYDPYYGWYLAPSTCPQTTRFYINATYAFLEVGAKAIKVTADHGAASAKLFKSGAVFNEFKFSFQNVFNGQKRILKITYQVPGGAPRSDSDTRIGQASASFCVIANGYDSGSTRVVAPSSFDLTVDAHGGTLDSTTAKGVTTFQTGPITSPGDFWACISGDNPAGYAKSFFTSPSGRPIELQAWPEDPTWSANVQGEIRGDLTKLEALIGRGLPGTGTVVIREVSSGELGAYAGTFDPKVGIARVSEDLETGTVAHELSHTWFNDALFSGRWLSEGSAGWAESTITGVKCADPGPYPGPGAERLYIWTFAGPKATQAELDAVDYEYKASCYLVSAVVARIDKARLTAVFDALLDHKLAYRSGTVVLDGKAEAEDLHQWLDAMDELGLVPSAVADLDFAQSLVIRFGAGPTVGSLVDRSAARAMYHKLVPAIGTWVVPEAILRSLAEWRFANATDEMKAETAAFAAATAADAALHEADPLDGPVKDAVAAAKTQADLDAAVAKAIDQQAAAEAMGARPRRSSMRPSTRSARSASWGRTCRRR